MSRNKQGALIGCGFFADNHMHAWKTLEGAEIGAVCDLDRAKATAMATKFGIARIYDDPAKMFDHENLDFVDVATTVESHLPLVRLASTHAKTVICQKPFAENMKDAHAMVAAAKNAGSNLLIHENFRWQKPFLTMKKLVDDGTIGTPHFAHFSFRHGYDNYVNQPYLAKIDRFAIMDVGLHLFDLARLFMGEVAHLSCTKQSLNPIVQGEDAFTALLNMENGGTCICDCSFYSKFSPEPFPNTAAVIEGDKGTVHLDRWNRLTVHTASGAETSNVDPAVPLWGAKPWHCVQDSVTNFQAHAIDVMHGRTNPRPSGEDNLRTMALALAAYDAAEQASSMNMAQWSED
ncbi:Predicted dehydrogenase [Cognatiyoonia koreensis]|uniref:Predicted dehydrogenase n=1 Tax=Cognatiyoonia koreensis TaxID=364200 RepID=A0A1I0RJV6_9RHOB|nr:Gfo/Idh/MocA family oxidoreductase [Cognatiyoonia koreensis]SEW40564.1 Predicted dehydrogenase [Cognatiyoonia koreensis]